MTAALVGALAILPLAVQSPTDVFLRDLQRALGRDDHQAVAAMMVYPLNVTAAGVRLLIRNREALIEHYDAIFTASMKAALADANARERVITVMPVEGAIKVIEIRVPVTSLTLPGSQLESTSSRDKPPKNSPRPPKSAPSATREPERIIFRAGGGSGQFAGALAAGQTSSYVFRATKGQLLEVRVDRVRARDVVAKVSDAASRTPLDARAAEGTRVWTGRVPADGDYRIDIVRLLRDGSAPLPYTLVVSLRGGR
jgi:hypothetical protein